MDNHSPHSSRRRFLHRLALGSAALAFSSRSEAQAEQRSGSVSTPASRKLGIALMGLGSYSSGELVPALKKATHCRLAGVITGDPGNKGKEWSRQHGFSEKNVFSYDTIAQIADNPEIDIIYVVTPPGLHKENVLAAAKTGKHIICEKPMANSVEECDAMIAACRAANVQLSIGYRLEFDPRHEELDRLAASKELGPFMKISGTNGMSLNKRVWRVDKDLGGGGPLMDLGVYIIQAAVRAARGASPIAVTAKEEPKKNPELFNEVEEALRFKLEFENGAVCEGFTSYAERMNSFRAEAEKGWFELQPAYGYRGLKMKTSQGKTDSADVPQQTLQMDDFARCVMTGEKTRVPGEMGRQHMTIIEAIYKAMRSGQRTEVGA